MAVEQVSFIHLPINFDENQRSQVARTVRDDFSLDAFDSGTFNPALNMLCCFLEVIPSMSIPLLGSMKAFADILDFDKVNETRKGGFHELLLDKLSAFFTAETRLLHLWISK